ncbi:MAG: SagB/ThcOx family dehydrogenase [Candidatus Wallbacteria bacterium]|nr:SagB/ThcOx family dehydrogenase [Candidatus Wallbacteria bacterium]
MKPVDVVLAYHERTKHHLSRYAEGPGYLDWSCQPDPFRTYRGATLVELPLLAGELPAALDELHAAGAIAPRPVELSSLSALLELSLGLSAWKELRGQRWALRCNPSSGNLHPTEGYVVTGGIPGLPAGVYHYVSRDHTLEQRCQAEEALAEALRSALPQGSFVVGFSSIHWRESWKYGERAYRYCQHDAGHAAAAVRYAAACLGWSAMLADEVGDGLLATVLGLDRSTDYKGVQPLDREHPDTAVLVCPDAAAVQPGVQAWTLSAPGLARLLATQGRWQGEANALSPVHVDWEVIEAAASAAARPYESRTAALAGAALPPMRSTSRLPATRLIRQRRSAQSLDGQTGLEASAFFAILDRLLPRGGIPPWDVLPWRPHLHCGIFVHRVSGLEPGLYAFERDEAVHDRLVAECRPDFAWERPASCPSHLRLYRLVSGDTRETAQIVSCHQEIAADGAFSLGMLADFGDSIRARGGWWWRRLFWESGVLGQALYLEAEAAGLRGTGIGCFFDDAFHQSMGLRTDRFQTLYHFTVGAAVEDSRLLTIPPYEHLNRGRP